MLFYQRPLAANKLICVALVALSLMFAASSAQAQVCASPGVDGPATLAGIINTYHAGSGSASSGSGQVTVASITGQRTSVRPLAVGDLVIAMQMQDSAVPANAGQYEYAQISSIAGAVLTLNRSLTNSYVQSITASAAGATTACRTFQVVRVPQYSNATVAAGTAVSSDAWTVNYINGQGTGGVVVLDVAGSTAVNGTITVDGAGFRGGAAFVTGAARPGGTFSDANYAFTNGNGALKGEGSVGTPLRSSTAQRRRLPTSRLLLAKATRWARLARARKEMQQAAAAMATLPMATISTVAAAVTWGLAGKAATAGR